MSADWTSLIRGLGVVENDAIRVELPDERTHRVFVRDAGEAWELEAVVARPSTVASLEDLPVDVWRRNRQSRLVGFRLDHRGRLVGEAWTPKAGLTADEFRFYVRRVATECDRFEYQLTGRDEE